MRFNLLQSIQTNTNNNKQTCTAKELCKIVRNSPACNKCRKYCNKNTGRIRRMFKWAAAEELVPVQVYQALPTVDGLKQGKTAAYDPPPVGPVDDATVEATLKHLNPTAVDMVRLQQLTGMRPGEVVLLQPCDIDRSDGNWVYRPESHKTQHRGRERTIVLGAQAQAILSPYLLRTEPERYCFRPYRKPGHPRYTVSGYRTAIRLATEKAGVERWGPNQLRHSAGTKVRRRYGLEAAQVFLGHAKADVTQVYAERDAALAARIAREVG